jgi:hypothetical protein
MQVDLCQPTSLKSPAHLSGTSCTPLGATAIVPLTFCQPSARGLPADLSKCCQRTSRRAGKVFPRLFLPGNLSRFVLELPRNTRQSQILHNFWCYSPQDCQCTSLVRVVVWSGFPEFSEKARGWLEKHGKRFRDVSLYRIHNKRHRGFSASEPLVFLTLYVRARSSDSVERLIGTIHASQPLVR